jgi:tetratricopeptide (TPR) repeat protein
MIDQVIALAGGEGGAAGVVPPYAASNRANALFTLGRHAEALDAAERAFGMTDAAHNADTQFRSLLTKAGALGVLGDLDARVRLDAGDRPGSQADAAHALEHLVAMLDQGDPDRQLAQRGA